MNGTLPPLPNEWVRRIFMRFEVVYGPALMAGTWGTGDKSMIIEGWAEDLKAFGKNPEAIKYALDNLPRDYPPNLIQFKDLCKAGVQTERPAILEHKVTPEEMEVNKARIREVLNGFTGLTRL